MMESTEESLKGYVNVLFKKLRNSGIVARQNFQDCSSCAGAALATELAPMIPVVYYHAQDRELMRYDSKSRWGYRRPHWTELGVYLRFSYTAKDGWDAEATPTQNAQLGRFIAACAQEVGLYVKWEGDPDVCIWVGLPREEEPTPETIAAIAVDIPAA